MNARNKKMLLIIASVVVVAIVAVVVVSSQKPTDGGDLPVFGGAVTVNGCTISRGCNCPGANLSNTAMPGLTFIKCNLSGASFTNSNL